MKRELADSWRSLKRRWRTARGHEIFPAPQLQCETLTLGQPGAAWSICPAGLPAAGIAYSLGVGEEISFDRELIDRFGMTVHAFDPTPRSIAWIGSQILPHQLIFHPLGIAAQDGLRRFHPPRNERHVSHTLLARGFDGCPGRKSDRKSVHNLGHNAGCGSHGDAERDSSGAAVEVPVRRLATMMQMLGHARIDLLKMDIEGAEYEVIDDLLGSRVAVDQLLIEFHQNTGS
jgi:FkbM family methyltransferase